MYNWHRFETRDALESELAQAITHALIKGIAERDSAVLVVSGGSTPLGLFRTLSKQDQVNWSKVTVTLADERWVPTLHDDSNHRLVAETLLQGPAAAADFLPLYTGAATPEDGCDDIAHTVSNLGTFDAVILGMGGDSHTASLFPNTPALSLGLDATSATAVLAVHPTTAPHPRISMSLARLLNTRNLILHFTGADKAEVFENAVAEGKSNTDHPIRAFALQDKHDLEVFFAP